MNYLKGRFKNVFQAQHCTTSQFSLKLTSNTKLLYCSSEHVSKNMNNLKLIWSFPGTTL